MSEPGRRTSSPDEDRILDLLHGLLTEEEQREALADLAADPEAEEILRRRARALERARARLASTPVPVHAFRQRLLAFLRSPGAVPLVGFGFAVAIVVALLRAPPGTSPGLHPLPAGSETLRLRSEGQLPEEVREGIEAYAAGDYERAADLFGSAAAEGTGDLVRRVYLGSALAMAGRPEESIPVLESLPLDRLPDPWGQEARWTWILALRSAGAGARADSALRAAAREPGELGDRARHLLESSE